MKLNTDRFHLIVSDYKHEQVWAQVGRDKIWESVDVKLLGVTIDRELQFDKHVSKICSKASRRVTVLPKKTIFKAFFKSQFKYCLIIYMFHSRYLNNKIN